MPHWRRIGLPTHSYGQIEQLVVQSRGRPHPRDVTELSANASWCAPAARSSLQLRDIQRSGVPGISLDRRAERLRPIRSSCSSRAGPTMPIVDANEFAFTQHLYPDVNVAFALPDPRPLQWVVRADGPDLLEAVDRFFAGAAASGELAQHRTRGAG